jgi:hypothetical protein
MTSGFVMVRFKRALPPGTYAVSWHMVSVPWALERGQINLTVS